MPTTIRPMLCSSLSEYARYCSEACAAGFDAQLFLEVSGENGSSGPWPLRSSAEACRPFQPGQVDDFELQLPSLGRLQKCTISHSGIAADVHLEKVVVTDAASQQVHPPNLTRIWRISVVSRVAHGLSDIVLLSLMPCIFYS